MIINRRYNNLAFVVLAVVIVFFSGCRVNITMGEYKISGRVTAADGETGIPGVRINYQINNYSWRWTTTSLYGQPGTWQIRADKGDRVKIWAQKENYLFQPAYRQINSVTGDYNNVDFTVSGWYDDFSNPSSGWAQDDSCGYNLGEYRLRATPPYYTRVMAPHPVPLSYTIEARISSYDDNGGYGFVFNYSGEKVGDYFHIFRVKPGGDLASGYQPYFQLLKAKIVGISDQGFVLDHEVIVNEINFGIEEYSNKLKVKQNWREVWLFINDDRVWTGFIEAEPVTSLDFGFYACADGLDDYEVWFDHLEVDGAVYQQSQIRIQASGMPKAFQDMVQHK
ncbi:MAG: hypothetical protein GX202_00360 [Firmicutes bacterium]|nr:hypothetical protein [Bacillota bacterium]